MTDYFSVGQKNELIFNVNEGIEWNLVPFAN